MEQLDNRGQYSLDGAARSAVVLVVGIAVLALMAAFLAPIAIDALEGDSEVTLNQSVDETEEVNSLLESTVTASTDDTDAEVELNDTRTTDTTSKTIDEGENATYDLGGGEVVVTVDEADDDYATAEYEYARDYTFSDGAQGLWGLIGFAVVLLILLFAVREATNRM